MADAVAERPCTAPDGTPHHKKVSDEASDKKIARVFKRFDKNGDGVIQRAELAQVLKSLSRDQFTDKSIKKVMDAVDTNKDGMISYLEFTSWLCGDEKGNQVMEMALNSAGPSKFFDKSTYTGVAAKGGPSVDDRNGVDLACVTRSNLNGGHTTLRVGAERAISLPPLLAATEGPTRARKDLDPSPTADPHRGPERFFYDKSSYTGTAAHGGAVVDDRSKCDFTQMVRPNLKDGHTALRVGHEEDLSIQCQISLLDEPKEPAPPPPPPPPNPYQQLSDDTEEATPPLPPENSTQRCRPFSRERALQRPEAVSREASRQDTRKQSPLGDGERGRLPQVQPTLPRSPRNASGRRPQPHIQKVHSAR